MTLDAVRVPDEARAADGRVDDPGGASTGEPDVLSLEVAIARASTQRILEVVTRYDAEEWLARVRAGEA